MVHLVQNLWLNARPMILGAGGVLGFVLVSAAFLSGLTNSLASV